jgi:hypothetical protein
MLNVILLIITIQIVITLRIITLITIMQSVVMLNVIRLSGIMLNVVYDEYNYVTCLSAECHHANCVL